MSHVRDPLLFFSDWTLFFFFLFFFLGVSQKSLRLISINIYIYIFRVVSVSPHKLAAISRYALVLCCIVLHFVFTGWLTGAFDFVSFFVLFCFVLFFFLSMSLFF